MNRYSFVLIDPRGSESNFRVGEFPGLHKALQLAEFVTLDLSIDPAQRWAGWILEVRDIHGQILVAKNVPVSLPSKAWVTARSAVVSSFSDCHLSFFDPFADLCVEIVEGALQRGLERWLSGERGGEAWA